MTASVLTGDIIGSSSLPPAKRQQLHSALERTFAGVSKVIPSFRAEQFRGDSFQALVDKEVVNALKALLLIHAFLQTKEFGVRIALGLGDISYDSGHILTSDGPAYQLSGLALDAIKKKNQLVSVTSPSESFNAEWKVHALSLTYLLQRWTVAQAEAVLGQLQGLTQEETAKNWQVRQPAIQQRLQAAGWPLMDAILERFVTSVHADIL